MEINKPFTKNADQKSLPYKQMWVCFDLDNGPAHGCHGPRAIYGYMWAFSAKKLAQKERARHKKHRYAELSKPVRCVKA